jgi:hypothetical protein
MNRLTTPGVTYGTDDFMESGIHDRLNKLSAYEDSLLEPWEVAILVDYKNNNKGVEEYFETCVARDRLAEENKMLRKMLTETSWR